MQKRETIETIINNMVTAPEEGRYVYCIADSAESVHLGKIGIDGNEVYTVPYKNICALVHKCNAEPYKSDDPEMVKSWVVSHDRVIETAWERWGTVLPINFDTIIKEVSASSAEQNLAAWLASEYDGLRNVLQRVNNKSEFGIQISWDPKGVAQQIIRTNKEIQEMESEIASESKGLAYMHRQKIEGLLKQEMESSADAYFREFFGRIKQLVDEIKIEKTKKAENGLQMILNVACLVERDKCQELGQALDSINNLENFSVRFIGPWPPYSFVSRG